MRITRDGTTLTVKCYDLVEAKHAMIALIGQTLQAPSTSADYKEERAQNQAQLDSLVEADKAALEADIAKIGANWDKRFGKPGA